MKYEEWIEQTKKVLHQYDEGAIFASEAFNAIVGRAYEVEIPQTEPEQQAELNASEPEFCGFCQGKCTGNHYISSSTYGY